MACEVCEGRRAPEHSPSRGAPPAAAEPYSRGRSIPRRRETEQAKESDAVLLNVKQVAEALNVSERSVWRLVAMAEDRP